MPRQLPITIGPETIGDYIKDIERRCGVRVQFSIMAPAKPKHKGDLALVLHMPAYEHREELHWVYPIERVWTMQNQHGLLWLMFDMLVRWDQVFEAGEQPL